MKNIIKIYLLLTMIIGTSAFSTELTETRVKTYLSKIESLAINLNIDGLSETLSEDVDITFKHIRKDKVQVNKINKEGFTAMLKKQWPKMKNYTYKMSNIVVVIDNEEAFVIAKINESYIWNGKIRTSNSKEEITIVLKDGNLITTKIVATTVQKVLQKASSSI